MKVTRKRIALLTPEQRRSAVVRRMHRPGEPLTPEPWVVHSLFTSKNVNVIALADVLREVVPWVHPGQTPELFLGFAISECPPTCRLRVEVQD